MYQHHTKHNHPIKYSTELFLEEAKKQSKESLSKFVRQILRKRIKKILAVYPLGIIDTIMGLVIYQEPILYIY